MGYYAAELWDLAHHIAKFTLPRLKAFVKTERSGVPDGLEMDQWDEILNEMIYGLENWERAGSDPRAQKGLELFGKYFKHLWD